MVVGSLLILAALSAGTHLMAWYRGVKWLEYVAKPSTTILLIAIALLLPASDPTYRLFIVAGLLFSLAGDVFLMLPGHHFVAGLLSFLVAHIAYIAAFRIDVGFGARPFVFLLFFVPAIVLLRMLWPHLQKLRVPVVLYVTVLIVMAGQAAARAMELDSAPAWLAASGGALFVVSDATLALNRFRRPFHAAQAIVMSTYVLAQALIALSIV